MTGKTIFFQPTHQTLADIIDISSPVCARLAIKKLDRWAGDDVARIPKAIRAATLAANRAELATKRKRRPLGPEDRLHMVQVERMYRGVLRMLSKRLDELKKRAAASARRAHKAA